MLGSRQPVRRRRVTSYYELGLGWTLTRKGPTFRPEALRRLLAEHFSGKTSYRSTKLGVSVEGREMCPVVVRVGPLASVGPPTAYTTTAEPHFPLQPRRMHACMRGREALLLEGGGKKKKEGGPCTAEQHSGKVHRSNLSHSGNGMSVKTYSTTSQHAHRCLTRQSHAILLPIFA